MAATDGIVPDVNPTVTSRPSGRRHRTLCSNTVPPTGSTIRSAPPAPRTRVEPGLVVVDGARTGPGGQLAPLGAARDREHLVAERGRDLHDRTAQPAPGAVHEHPVASLQPPAADERDDRGVVVHQRRRPLHGAQLHGQQGEPIHGHPRALREPAAHDVADHRVAVREPGPGRGGLDRAGHLQPGDERRRRPDLVAPAGEQGVDEPDARRVHLDQGRRLRRGAGDVDLVEPQPVRSDRLVDP